MKKLFILSMTATMVLSACGEKGNLQLTATNRGNGQTTGTGTNAKVSGAFKTPDAKITESKVVAQTQAGRRNLVIQKKTVLSGYLCVKNLLEDAAMKETDSLKMQIGSQLIMVQDTTVAAPDNELVGKQAKEPLKPLVNLVCRSSATSGRALVGAIDENSGETLQVAKIAMGKIEEVTMNLGVGKDIQLTSVRIGCMDSDKIVDADKGLLLATADGADMIMATGSKIQIETSDDDGKTSRSLILGCEKTP